MDIDGVEKILRGYAKEGKLDDSDVSRVIDRMRQANRTLAEAINDRTGRREQKVVDAVEEYNVALRGVGDLMKKLT
jgi:3-oxoacyl-[acyl-carrier-protein] synthase III